MSPYSRIGGSNYQIQSKSKFVKCICRGVLYRIQYTRETVLSTHERVVRSLYDTCKRQTQHHAFKIQRGDNENENKNNTKNSRQRLRFHAHVYNLTNLYEIRSIQL